MERGFRRIVLVVSMAVFVFSGWQVWEVVDQGVTERRWRAWAQQACAKGMAGQVIDLTELTDEAGALRPAAEELKEACLELTIDEAIERAQNRPPIPSSKGRAQKRQQAWEHSTPWPLWIWTPWETFWLRRPWHAAWVGALTSAGLALIPWGIFYLLRWIAAGFRASP